MWAAPIPRCSCVASASNSVRSRRACSPPTGGRAAARIVGGPSGDTLVGYVVADTGADVDPVAVQSPRAGSCLRTVLPVVLVVDALPPLTANGNSIVTRYPSRLRFRR